MLSHKIDLRHFFLIVCKYRRYFSSYPHFLFYLEPYLASNQGFFQQVNKQAVHQIKFSNALISINDMLVL